MTEKPRDKDDRQLLRRRHVLGGAGVGLITAIAGCASGDDSTPGDEEDTEDDEPEQGADDEQTEEQGTDNEQEDESQQEENDNYIIASADELLPDEVGDDWPDQELERDDEFSPEDGRVFVTPDEEIAIFMDAINRASAETAEEAMQRFEAELTETDTFPLADQAFVAETNEIARCYFREANAIGQVGAVPCQRF